MNAFSSIRLQTGVSLLTSALLLPWTAHAQPDETQEAPPMAAPKPPPYSLPFQLRPVVVGNVVRSDTAFAFYENAAGNSGSTVVTTLLGALKVTDQLAPLVRLGLVSNSPPDPPAGGTGPDSAAGFLNPVVGATFAVPFDSFRLGLFLGLALPIGSGGGDDPDLDVRAALAAGILARSAMDNAMFAVNYLTVFPGVGLAYVAGGFTAQVEVTLLQLTRVRGEDVDTDESRTNFTTGLHVGYFLVPALSLGAELRHQRWLSTPAMVEANENLRDNTTVAFGPRAHFELAPKTWLRPGIAYARGLDKPMTDANYHIIQLDVALAF
jgi:hypothetical protein